MSRVKSLKTRIQHKHDLEINWNKASGFIPLPGELIIYDKEIDPKTGTTLLDSEGNKLIPEGREAYTYDRFKIGDGKTIVKDLGFINEAIEENIQDNLISFGTEDPNTETMSKFYFKYSE